MIGINILASPQAFLTAFNDLGDDIAVHTWSHRHMSTLTNEQLIAEFGWCMQIIHDSTGGRVPALWRPPYGDADNRVRAIASEIFGLTTVMWNNDSGDWNIGSSGVTLESVEASMAAWLAGPRSPGLIILEHEITQDDVTNFLTSYPLMKSANWNMVPVGQLTNHDWYKNSKNNTSPVSNMDLIQYPPKPSTTSTTTTASSTSIATGTATVSSTQLQGSSSPMAAPCRLNTLLLLVLTLLGAYCL